MPPKKKNTVKAAPKTKHGSSESAKLAALATNNKSLAAALDEARLGCHRLQTQNLQLQEERQALLERVNRQECYSKQMHCVLVLLNESEKKIKQARDLLCSSASSVFPVEPAPVFSPITDSKVCTKDPTTSITVATKLSYPKTPHPLAVNFEALQPLSSTPDTSDSAALPGPQKIDFDQDTPQQCKTKFKLSAVSEGKCCSPDEGDQPQDETDISPGLPEPRPARGTVVEKSEAAAVSRPRRACSAFNISYQEPSLLRKLRRGDPFTERSTEWNPPTHGTRHKSFCTSKKQKHTTLQDVTNIQ